jgi:hypothetical protein
VVVKNIVTTTLNLGLENLENLNDVV